MFDLAKHRLIFFFSIIILVVTATFFAIKFAKGYRIDFSSITLKPTGLLVATSTPPGAQVFVDDRLKTATDNTLSLSPGQYEVEIKKRGFLPWKKRLTIEKELVTQTEAFLFPEVPDLKPLTFHEAQNPRLSPDGTRIVYAIPLPNSEAKTQSTEVRQFTPYPSGTGLVNEGGLWIMELTDFFFNIDREPRQIVQSQVRSKDFSQANYGWSPDAKQIWVEFSSGEKYLLDPNVLNTTASLANVAVGWSITVASWEKETKLRKEVRLRRTPEKLQAILASNSAELNFSPDGTKILYEATTSAEIPEHLIPPVLAASTQKEDRKIKPRNFYVYDLKEDKNFLIPFTPLPVPSATKTPIRRSQSLSSVSAPLPLLTSHFPPVSWFPTSRHLYWIDGDKVVSCEYDGTNLSTIYSGPFVKPFVFAAPGANKLVILTQINFDLETKLNLYTVSLR